MAQTAARINTAVFTSTRIAPRSARARCLTCRAAVESEQSTRRGLLAGIALIATAGVNAPALASSGRWDGVSSAIGSCELGDAGADCRQAILEQDSAKLSGSYDKAVGTKAGARVAGGVPVGATGDKYSRDTLALIAKVEKYAELNSDPANPERLALVKELKTEFPSWVSKYARGGSARTVSARKVYVVADAISAHFATNGLAPMPAFKLKKLVADVEAAQEALAEGR